MAKLGSRFRSLSNLFIFGIRGLHVERGRVDFATQGHSMSAMACFDLLARRVERRMSIAIQARTLSPCEQDLGNAYNKADSLGLFVHYF